MSRSTGPSVAVRRCSVEECDRPHFAKGHCNTHYNRLWRNGTLDTLIQSTVDKDGNPLPCEVHGCEAQRRRTCADMRVCIKHGARYDRHGSFEISKTTRSARRVCSAPDCELIEDGNAGLCKKHDTRRRRHGDPATVIHPDDRKLRRGPAHPHWNAGGSYSATHQRLRKRSGRASEYRCVKCGNAAAQWAYQHGSKHEQVELVDGVLLPFSSNLDDYAPMCVPCHKRMDMDRINGDEETAGIP